MTIKFGDIGLALFVVTCLQILKQSQAYGVSSGRGSQMGRLTNIKLVSVLMVVCKLGEQTIERGMLWWLIGLVFAYF
jgi:hypothetical protein